MQPARAALVLLALAASLAPATADAVRARPLRTGQVTTYGATGDISAGLERIYENGDGWIRDRRTGLTWEKKDDAGGIHDKDNRYSWSTSGSIVGDGTAFTEFLATLNRPPCFAGFCDWRMPTRAELETLLDIGRTAPAVPGEFRSSCTRGCTTATCSCTASGFHWSSSTYDFMPDSAWDVNFEVGTVNVFVKQGRDFVRAVRP